MVECVCGVLWGNLVVPVDDPQFGSVLKGVCSETEGVQETPQCPDVCLLVHRMIAIQVHHLGGAVAGCGVTIDLCNK